MCEISILIPAYGEGRNLREIIEASERALSGRDFEIIIVNDENPDGSVEIIKRLETEYGEVRGLFSDRRRGKTRAIIDGFKRANGDIIVMLDADLQYLPEDVPKLIEALGYADVVNGLRVCRKDNLMRKVESKIYNFLVEVFFGVQIRDCDSGLKVFKREVLEDIIEYLEEGWHRYILPLAFQKGYRIAEVPVIHNPRKAGQTKFPTSPNKLFKGFLDLLSVKLFIIKNNFKSA
jgi:glycosyltransferase involved in cell wall biosynthesis